MIDEVTSDQYGRVIYNRHDLYDLLYEGIDISNITSVEWHEDFEKYNRAISANYVSYKETNPVQKYKMDIPEFDEMNQSNWFVPDEYRNIDVEEYLFKKAQQELQTTSVDFVYNSSKWLRVEHELDLFNKYGLEDVLKLCIYLVETMRENNIVW